MSTLQEQVAAIKRGDTVTARFNLTTAGTFTVSGVVHGADDTDWLLLGTSVLWQGGELPPYLVEIESHEPAPMLPPEPTGDVLVHFGPGTSVWEPADPEQHKWENVEIGHESTWAELCEAGAAPRAYRPVPSPEAVEALVQEFAVQIESQLQVDGHGERLPEWLLAFAERLLGVAS